MDRLDAELVLVGWDQASDDDRRAAAGYGVSELTAELAAIEAEVPGIAEKVCTGSAAVRDFPAMARAYQASVAVLSWRRTYPDLAGEWDKLAGRALAALRSLDALDPSGSWSPPMADGGHPG